MKKLAMVLALLVPQLVCAQTMNLLGVSSGMPATTVVQPPKVDAYSITMLARCIAAEAGGDYFSGPDAKESVGATVVNIIQSRYGIKQVTADDIHRLLRDQPGYLSSLHDGNAGLFNRDAKWFKANGYRGCLVAAKAVLNGADPSGGATHWYDASIPAPYSARRIRVTHQAQTAGKKLVFYVFR